MTLSPQVTKQYTLGPVKPWVENAAYIVGPLFGIKDIGGWRQSDPFPDHPSGHALDYMVPDKQTGDALAQYQIDNWQALGVKYLVWDHRAWNPQIGWHPYTSSPNPHTDHVHTTYLDTPGTATGGPVGSNVGLVANTNDTCAWMLSGPKVPLLGGPQLCILSKKEIRVIVGFMLSLTGTGIMLAGVLVLTALALGVKPPTWAQSTPIINRLLPPRKVYYFSRRDIYKHDVTETPSE